MLSSIKFSSPANVCHSPLFAHPFAMIDIFILLLHFSMQVQFSEQYSDSEIYEARDEIVKLQNNLNKIEQLYQQLYTTLDNQQAHVEQIGVSVKQTEVSLEKGALDLYQFSQLRRKKDKRQCFVMIFIGTTACFFLLIVISALINVMQTFGYKSRTK